MLEDDDATNISINILCYRCCFHLYSSNNNTNNNSSNLIKMIMMMKKEKLVNNNNLYLLVCVGAFYPSTTVVNICVIMRLAGSLAGWLVGWLTIGAIRWRCSLDYPWCNNNNNNIVCVCLCSQKQTRILLQDHHWNCSQLSDHFIIFCLLINYRRLIVCAAKSIEQFKRSYLKLLLLLLLVLAGCVVK